MLRALGFRSRSLAVLVLAENGFLLVLGLLSGTVSALLAVSPHLLSGGADVPWVSLLLTLAAVLVVGMASGLAAAVSALRGPLLPALRGE
jgi:ABC-type antimicrobial peptide transport system permease subunit